MANKILVPLDGSDLAEQVLPYATALATKTGASLVLLSAVVPAHTWLRPVSASETSAEEFANATAYLQSVEQKLTFDGKVMLRVESGSAAECVRRVADDERADIIAMTTHGRSGLPRLVLGSVASEVTHTASQAVLLVRAAKDQPPAVVDIRRILVPVDGSRASESVLPVIEELAQRLAAEIVLERVVVARLALYGAEYVPSSRPVLDELEEAAKDYVTEVARRLSHHGVRVSGEIMDGIPVPAILDAAERNAVDLIAMSSHSRSAPGRWLLGSTADGVVRQSHLPCLIIRPAMDKRAEGHEPAVTEIIEGVSVAKIVIPAPDMTEVAAQGAPVPHSQTVRQHRPERRNE